MSTFVDLDHPRFHRVQAEIFTRRLVADCMSHACTMVASGHQVNDACCQYGADTDLGERDRILARADELKAILRPDAAAAPWFTTTEELDDGFPSGAAVRTLPLGDGCVFLAHDRRGCAIHRAALEHGWDFRGTKPHVCRLFPMTYDDAAIMISDDYADYSCAFDATAPSLYQVTRDTLGDVFGPELVAALDRAEAAVLAAQPKRLPVV
jgi:Fe-S-cluster containining protein